MGCTTSIVKYLLFFFNLAFVLASIAFIAIGVLFKLGIDDYTEQIEKVTSGFSVAPTLMIIIGCVVFVIAFFGCCGAIRESTCMLTTYAIILLTLFLLQVALGVYAFLQFKDSDSGEIKDEITKGLLEQLSKYGKDNEVTEAIDSLQKGLTCCGVRAPTDWDSYPPWNSGLNLPKSCCPENTSICTSTSAYHQGCSNKLFDYVKQGVQIVGIVVISIAAAELIGAIIGLCLSSSIRNSQRRGNYA